MAYKYAIPTYQPKVSADVVGEEFERIEKANGELTKENVLDSARDEDSPLHSFFEWNDSIAAEKYRLRQAQNLIHMVITVHDNGTETRSYVNTNAGHEKSRYINFKDAMANDEYREAVLANAKNEAKTFRNKYATLKELAAVFAEIDKL